MKSELRWRLWSSAAGLLALYLSVPLASGQLNLQPAEQIPNMGQQITPLGQLVTLNPHLADNPDVLASQAMSTAVSPDHKTLLVLTSGYNRVYALGVPAPPYPWYGPDSNE